MVDYIADIMNSTFLGIPTIMIVAILIGLIIFAWKHKPKAKEFKKINVIEETRKKYKELFESMGTDKIGKKLLWGYEVKGIIGRLVVKNWKELAENKESIEIEVFEVYNKKLIGRIKYLLNFKPMYFIVPKTALTENAKEIMIDTAYHYDNLLGTMTFSKSARDVVADESYKINNETALNEMVNWLPLQSYLSVQHAQSSEGLDHLAEIEKVKRDEAVSEMVGKKKK